MKKDFISARERLGKINWKSMINTFLWMTINCGLFYYLFIILTR